MEKETQEGRFWKEYKKILDIEGIPESEREKYNDHAWLSIMEHTDKESDMILMAKAIYSSFENIKDNKGKPPMRLITQFYTALCEVAYVTEFGNTKYEPNSWGRVPVEDYESAALRHIFKAIRGEDVDEESGFDHWAHAAWNCLAILCKRLDKN